jgi:hypothetical protein
VLELSNAFSKQSNCQERPFRLRPKLLRLPLSRSEGQVAEALIRVARGKLVAFLEMAPTTARRRSSMVDINRPTDWESEDEYWRTNYRTRPYVSGTTREYDYYQPGYRYGYESANQYQGRRWEDVETDLQRDWGRYEYRGQSTWEQMKNAVRDAWDRVAAKFPVAPR